MSASDTSERDARASALAQLLLWSAGALFALGALFGPTLVRALANAPSLSGEALRETRRSRFEFALAGALLALAGLALLRLRPRLFTSRVASRALLASCTLGLALFVLERALRPFVEPPTTIFARDPELGWRLVPNAADEWLGVPVRINAQGQRGPVHAIPKPAGTRRALFLGDSVVFGAFLERDDATIPAQVEARLAESDSTPVECVNAGVGGYAAWQELAWLEREGTRYEPDLVVLNFVLNDVTEPLELARFGGTGEGFQLEHAVEPGPLRWVRSSAIYRGARELLARLHSGSSVAEGARSRETAGVYELILDPNAERVQRAWTACMMSLDGIVAWCRARELPLLLVVHPYALQLADPIRNAPQWILARFAERRGLPMLDLLPPLAERLRAEGASAEPLYVDQVHPNARGAAEIAGLLAPRVAELLRRGPG